ncbi:MAG: methanogenesis marker 3 protein [Thermoplasmata archaeon]|nr:methanogenesis marker 3 protein [Thermoplasmata archaeon]
MKITVNGKEKTLKAGATLADALKGENYSEGSDVSVFLSAEKVTQVSNDFDIVTPHGVMTLHLDDTEDAKLFRKLAPEIKGINTRWVTNSIVAFGSFPTDIKKDETPGRFRRNDVFFVLGGNDNATTYVMVARKDQERVNGTGGKRIGWITGGRFLLSIIDEGDVIEDIAPTVSETSVENVIVTKDLSTPLEEGCSVDSEVLIRLNEKSPESAEQVLILASKGYYNVSESTGTFMGCRDDLDVEIPAEDSSVRDVGSVAVRHDGGGKGHVLFYRERRQISQEINIAGSVERGMALVMRAAEGDRVTVSTDPIRLLSVGMTQKEAGEFLAAHGIKQVRKGDVSDDAVVADQFPEVTVEVAKKGEAETVGIPKDEIKEISITCPDEATAHFFRKVTGLSHKPIGQLKVQFSFPDSPMVTFFGDEARAQDLTPQDELFKKCKKGDIGVTNQARPHHGLIGIRLKDSKEYGPTGEEPYGTNLVGRFLSPLDGLDVLDDNEIIYIREVVKK